MASVFQIDGIEFAGGLIWQTVPPGTNLDHIKEIASDFACDLFVMREQPPVQYGFAKSDEVKAGVFSAAAAINKTLAQEHAEANVLAAIPLGNNSFMLYAQRSYVIDPDRGDVIGSKDDVWHLFRDKFASAAWDAVFAPDTWGESGTVERDFKSFLPQNKKGKVIHHKWWRLRAIERKSIVLPVVIGVALLGGAAFFGMSRYDQYKADLLAKEQQILNAATAATQKRMNEEAQKALTHPWASQPPALDYALACEGAMASLPLTPGGWMMESFSCSNGSWVASFSRGNATSIDIKGALPGVMLSPDGNTSTSSGSLGIEGAQTDETVLKKAESYEKFASYFQRNGFLSSISETAVVVPAPADPSIQKPIPDWGELSFMMETPFRPSSFISFFDVPGFRVNTIIFTVNSGVWKTEGKIYVQP